MGQEDHSILPISITVAVVAIIVILMVKILKNQVPTLVTPMVLNPHP